MLRKKIGSERISLSLATLAFLFVGQFFIGPILRVAQSQAPPSQSNTTTIDPGAIEVLEKHIAAIGGRDVLKADKTIETQIEREVMGTTSRVYRIEDRTTGRSYTLTDGPNGKIEQGFDGKRAWRKAPFFRGYLPESDPQTRAATNRRAPLYEYKESGLVFKKLPNETVSGKEYIVLAGEEMDPLGRAIAVRYYFDPQTYLLGQVVRGGEVTQVTVFDDYRKVDGRMVAFRTTITTPQATIKARLLSLKHNVPVEDSTFQYREEASSPAGTPSPSPTPAAPPPKPAASVALSEAARVETFELVWRTINDTYWDPTFGGIDWRAIHDKYLPLIKTTTASDVFHQTLNRMVGELHRSHFKVIPPERVRGLHSRASELMNGTVGLDLRWIGNQILVVEVEQNSAAQAAGVRKGYVVMRLDGKTPEQLLTHYRESNPGFRLREEIERERAVQSALNGQPESKVSVTLLDEKNKTLTLELSRRAQPLTRQLTFESKRLIQSIGYIRFNIFLGDVLTKFQEALRDLSNTKAIIIDLRGNPGGLGQLAPAMASLISARDGSLGRFKFRYETQAVAFKGTDKASYNGQVILLVDELSGSTSEVFAGGLQASGRALVLGSKTAGAVLPSLLRVLPTGGALQHVISNFETPNGTVLEGRGVIPDIVVQLSRAGLLGGHDAPLERATEVIRAGKMVASSERAQPNISLQVSRGSASRNLKDPVPVGCAERPPELNR